VTPARRCALCAFWHWIPWSAFCAFCWGVLRGRVPDEVGDEEVIGRG
jgi:hypothetical protein